MKVYNVILLFLFFILSPFTVYSQEEKKAASIEEEQQRLNEFSDDIRFENAYRFYRLKYYDKALQYLGEYIEVFSDGSHRSEALNTIAEIYYQKYDYPRAIKYYYMLFEENNNDEIGLKAYYNIGMCYDKMGYHKKAQNIFSSIIEQYPTTKIAADARLQIEVNDIIK